MTILRSKSITVTKYSHRQMVQAQLWHKFRACCTRVNTERNTLILLTFTERFLEGPSACFSALIPFSRSASDAASNRGFSCKSCAERPQHPFTLASRLIAFYPSLRITCARMKIMRSLQITQHASMVML